MKRVSKKDEALVRHQLKRQFQKLAWLPYPELDRMWSTRGSTTNCVLIGKKPSLKSSNKSPIIALNAEHCPTVKRVVLTQVVPVNLDEVDEDAMDDDE